MLYLDDVRRLDTVYPNADPRHWVIARNYDQFVDAIEKRGLPEFVSFDFDLGASPNASATGKKSGLDCAIFLLETCMEEHAKLPKWYVHSANKQNGPKLHEFLRVCQKILNT